MGDILVNPNEKSTMNAAELDGVFEHLDSLLRCPVSAMLFKNPVVLNDGYIYENTIIQEILSSQNKKSPMTRQPINSIPRPIRIIKSIVDKLAKYKQNLQEEIFYVDTSYAANRKILLDLLYSGSASSINKLINYDKFQLFDSLDVGARRSNCVCGNCPSKTSENKTTFIEYLISKLTNSNFGPVLSHVIKNSVDFIGNKNAKKILGLEHLICRHCHDPELYDILVSCGYDFKTVYCDHLPFNTACRYNNIPLIKKMLEDGFNLLQSDKSCTPLPTLVIKCTDIDLVKRVLDSVQNERMISHIITLSACIKRIELIHHILQTKNIHLNDEICYRVFWILLAHLANLLCHYDIIKSYDIPSKNLIKNDKDIIFLIKYFIERGIDYDIPSNIKEHMGLKPIQMVCMSGNIELIHYFLNLKPDIFVLTHNKETLLNIIPSSSLDLDLIIRLLLTGINYHIPDRTGYTLLHKACSVKNLDVINFIFDKLDDFNINAVAFNGTSAFEICIKNRIDMYILKRFLDKGASFNHKGSDGKLHLEYVMNTSNKELIQFALRYSHNLNVNINGSRLIFNILRQKTDVETLKICFSSMIDIHCSNQSDNGWMPVHYAIRYQSFDVAKMLIDNTENLDKCKTTDGYLPIHVACAHASDDIIFYLIFEKSLPINIPCKYPDGTLYSCVDLLSFNQKISQDQREIIIDTIYQQIHALHENDENDKIDDIYSNPEKFYKDDHKPKKLHDDFADDTAAIYSYLENNDVYEEAFYNFLEHMIHKYPINIIRNSDLDYGNDSDKSDDNSTHSDQDDPLEDVD